MNAIVRETLRLLAITITDEVDDRLSVLRERYFTTWKAAA